MGSEVSDSSLGCERGIVRRLRFESDGLADCSNLGVVTVEAPGVSGTVVSASSEEEECRGVVMPFRVSGVALGCREVPAFCLFTGVLSLQGVIAT